MTINEIEDDLAIMLDAREELRMTNSYSEEKARGYAVHIFKTLTKNWEVHDKERDKWEDPESIFSRVVKDVYEDGLEIGVLVEGKRMLDDNLSLVQKQELIDVELSELEKIEPTDGHMEKLNIIFEVVILLRLDIVNRSD